MTDPRTVPERSGFRCADAARERADPLTATAGPARRLLLVEVPGPWGPDALAESRFPPYVAGRLADAAARAGVCPLLVRRPGRHAAGPLGDPVPAPGLAVAVADLGTGAVRWSTWRRAQDVLDVDLRGPVEPSGLQQVALVCTHARHDLCCALRGRPVAQALAARTSWDVWECSHVGGDRFAANAVLLPEGDLLGGLDPDAAVAALGRYDAGRLPLEHHRGRFGVDPVAQAALHHAATVLADDRRGAVQVRRLHRDGDEHWRVEVRHEGTLWCATVVGEQSAPDRLTCRAAGPARVRRFRVTRWQQEGVVGSPS